MKTVSEHPNDHSLPPPEEETYQQMTMPTVGNHLLPRLETEIDQIVVPELSDDTLPLGSESQGGAQTALEHSSDLSLLLPEEETSQQLTATVEGNHLLPRLKTEIDQIVVPGLSDDTPPLGSEDVQAALERSDGLSLPPEEETSQQLTVATVGNHLLPIPKKGIN